MKSLVLVGIIIILWNILSLVFALCFSRLSKINEKYDERADKYYDKQ